MTDLNDAAALSGAAPIPQPELTDERLMEVFSKLDGLSEQDATTLRIDAEGGYVDALDLIGARHAWRAFEKAARAIEREVRSLLAASPAQEAQQPSSEKPALQVGAERAELLALLREIRPMADYGRVGTRDIDQARYQRALDKAIAALTSPASTEGALQGSGHAPATDGVAPSHGGQHAART